ncbi:Zn-dependent peptidase [Secundilactobacillus oryzae JCM 18671]|uniref:Zn-dependent peptidase n=2 Tax=Secundilactobacillus oryzae TaxID=1202668 RepID=A0A081BIP7_9LACO|nr:pitrilysin family protein [Secundilactobacillus oryzae]GAK47915.1 Zn-dependent peptidase [Secundilactobacillus oryzae JCM 18671]
MQTKDYKQLQEKMMTQTLENGLTVHFLPKPLFNETYAVLSTNYGSIDDRIIPANGENLVKFPGGLAHFLEHKLFEKEDHDASDVFAQYGASTNAYTSFTKTSYLFSSSRNLKENLDNLLDFVQIPYFSNQTVEKEIGIIGQEIMMYDDDPNWQAYFGAIADLYPDTALAVDIAGTVPSIKQITPEKLYLAHKQFYQPSNMSLFVVGNLDVDQVLEWVQENQAKKDLYTFNNPKRVLDDFYSSNIKHAQTLHMAVQRPKVTIGIKGTQPIANDFSGLVYEEAVNTMFDLLFGETSENYLRLYDQGVIDDSFGYSFEMQRAAHFAIIIGETNQPDAMVQEIRSILLNAKTELAKVEDRLEMVKREAMGATIMSMNSISAIANDYDDYLYGGTGLFDEIDAIRQLTMADIYQAAERFISEDRFSIRQILPE